MLSMGVHSCYNDIRSCVHWLHIQNKLLANQVTGPTCMASLLVYHNHNGTVACVRVTVHVNFITVNPISYPVTATDVTVIMTF